MSILPKKSGGFSRRSLIPRSHLLQFPYPQIADTCLTKTSNASFSDPGSYFKSLEDYSTSKSTLFWWVQLFCSFCSVRGNCKWEKLIRSVYCSRYCWWFLNDRKPKGICGRRIWSSFSSHSLLQWAFQQVGFQLKTEAILKSVSINKCQNQLIDYLLCFRVGCKSREELEACWLAQYSRDVHLRDSVEEFLLTEVKYISSNYFYLNVYILFLFVCRSNGTSFY